MDDSEVQRRRPRFDADSLEWGRLSDWAQLVRLPNVFTVLSDSTAAALLVGVGLRPLTFLMLLLASVLAYWAGMILNDVVDLEEDKQARGTRPLAAGRISPVIAGHVATGFLLTVPVLNLLITKLYAAQPVWMGLAFVASAALAICVRAYNSVLKKTPIGPLLMGLCRSLNILMVGATIISISEEPVGTQSVAWFAAGIGLYIVGITVYARREERESSQGTLSLGLGLEMIGLAIVAALPLLDDSQRQWKLGSQTAYPLLIGLIALTVINRGVAGVLHPVSRKVQLAVKHAILTLILLDATVAALCAGPWYGAAVAILLVPAMTAGQWFRST